MEPLVAYPKGLGTVPLRQGLVSQEATQEPDFDNLEAVSALG